MNFQILQDPPKEYSPAPLWFLNGKLEKEEIVRQVADMASHGVYNFFLHARAYLETPYLEDEWWEIIEAAVAKAEEVGAYAWLYDEYAWPSGTAGSIFKYGNQKPSRVLAKGEKNMAKGLEPVELVSGGQQVLLDAVQLQKKHILYLIAVTRDQDGKIVDTEDLTARIGARGSFEVRVAENQMVYGFFRKINPEMVDYLNKSAIQDFIQSTHEQYKKHIGAKFGTTVPGIFFDEIYNSMRPIVWTDEMPKEFYARKGYDIAKALPYVIGEIRREDEKYRVDYHEVVAQLYEEAFFQQISDWCRENNLMLTGHTEEDIAYHPLKQGNYFWTMRHLDIPGSDCHDYRYRYPRIITPEEAKFSVSVARLYGKKRAMSEALGGAGWNCSLQEFKRGINRLGALGSSLFVLHGFFYEAEHQGSQGDWPTSFFYQNPYWKYFERFSNYIARVSYMNAQGESATQIAIFYPIREIQSEFQDGKPSNKAMDLGRGFNDLLEALLQAHMDADFFDIDSFRKGIVKQGRLVMGEEKSAVLLFPQGTTLCTADNEKLENLKAAGIHIFYYDEKNIEDVVCQIENLGIADFKVIGNKRGVFHYNHRRIDGEDVFFVANAKDEYRVETIELNLCGTVRAYSMETGKEKEILKIHTYPDRVRVTLEFEADEACYLVVTHKQVFRFPDTWEMLPIPFEKDNTFVYPQKSSELTIPIAQFSSDLDETRQEIRICNTKDEKGFCGRHLTNWKGSWITRRTSWNCDSNKKDLYFRKICHLDSSVERADLCVASVGTYQLYINGKKVAEGESQQNPDCISCGEFWKAGDNLVAIHVHNENAMPGYNALEAKELPRDGIISLLLEGNVITEQGTEKIISDETFLVNDRKIPGWNTELEFRAPVYQYDTSLECFWKYDFSGKWYYAWERGRSPLLPWGEIPLFGQVTPYPRKCRYEIQIPQGAVYIERPEVQGVANYYLDGDKIIWEDEKYRVPDCDSVHMLVIEVQATNPQDGLKKCVTVGMKLSVGQRGDWRSRGLEWFSGRMAYIQNVRLQKKEAVRYFLEMREINFEVEVWVNRKYVDSRIWKPYRVDITDALADGENELLLIVSNLAGNIRRHSLVDEGKALAWNRYWTRENIDRDAHNLVSGIIGEVYLSEQVDPVVNSTT